MRHIQILLTATVLIIALAGCAGKPAPEKLTMKGADTVCILSKDKPFKNEVISRVTRALESKGRRVVRDENGHSDHFRAADYGAVIYFAEYWAWRTPRHAIRYYERNGKASNIIVVITAGDPDVEISKPFDAVTSASSSKNTDRVAEEILKRLDGILK